MRIATTLVLSATSILMGLSACSPQDRRPPGPRQCKLTLIHADPSGSRLLEGELVQGDEAWVILKIGEDRYRWIPRENVCHLELEQALKKE